METTEIIKLSVFLTLEEHQSLREHAAKSGLSMTKKAAEIIRKAVAASQKKNLR